MGENIHTFFAWVPFLVPKVTFEGILWGPRGSKSMAHTDEIWKNVKKTQNKLLHRKVFVCLTPFCSIFIEAQVAKHTKYTSM